MSLQIPSPSPIPTPKHRPQVPQTHPLLVSMSSGLIISAFIAFNTSPLRIGPMRLLITSGNGFFGLWGLWVVRTFHNSVRRLLIRNIRSSSAEEDTFQELPGRISGRPRSCLETNGRRGRLRRDGRRLIGRTPSQGEELALSIFCSYIHVHMHYWNIMYYKSTCRPSVHLCILIIYSNKDDHRPMPIIRII